jgi:D-alanyl-D-alanine carboxypeptidase
MNPTSYFRCVTKYALHSTNVTILGDETLTGSCSAQQGFIPIFSITSPPFSTIMNTTLQASDNLFAEHFLRTLGATQAGDAAENGIALVQKVPFRAFRGLCFFLFFFCCFDWR